jgi:hypothetical protein
MLSTTSATLPHHFIYPVRIFNDMKCNMQRFLSVHRLHTRSMTPHKINALTRLLKRA